MLALGLGLALFQAPVQNDPFKFSQAKATAWIFVATDCPISNSYAPEYARLYKAFEGKGVRWLLVYPDKDTTSKDIAKHRSDFKLEMPGISDASRRLTRFAGATVTPQAVVFDAKGKKVYSGRIDDLWPSLGKRQPKATDHSLSDALTDVLTGKAPRPAKGKAVGCAIP